MDQTPGHTWLLSKALDLLVEKALAEENSAVWTLTPYIEQMGTWNGKRKEFWWEREWRYAGDFQLPDLYIILCPESDMKTVKQVLGRRRAEDEPAIPIIDPNWGLEQIIARLAGFDSSQVGPF